ncbi:hypothetical protein BDA96_06G272700 [Sorghum bicolor]|uniref:PDZ domain-containing protein n=1 Tax=Sorghum bicolor TaxID=4558 RepID=A0A921QTF1_SORBI|nr:hypothetical protein BDA96_06G272700 [Sorghum bicolor]
MRRRRKQTAEGKGASALKKAKPGESSTAQAGAPQSRYPPFSTSGKINDLQKWNEECHKISDMLEKDPDRIRYAAMEPKDSGTTNSVQSPGDKMMILRAARGVVHVSIMHDGERLPQCSGIIIRHWSETPACHHAIIVTCSEAVCIEGRKLDPLPKLSVGLSDKKTVLDAELLYLSDHYDIALLRISLDFPLELPSVGHGPEYGQEVFVLARDDDMSLGVRHGNVKWLEESNILGRDFYMFLSCDLPVGGNGGMVIDHSGKVRGMVVSWDPHPAVISISTIVKCDDMFRQFNRVARPILGLNVRTIAMLDVQLQEDLSDIDINSGYLIDKVQYDSDAENHGIKLGHVIISINGRDALTLPELEDYLLSIGLDYLRDNSMNDIKLIVCELRSGVRREVALPARFSDACQRLDAWAD